MSSEKGESLIEVLVASTVGILVVSALTFATIFSLRNAQFAKNSSQATKLAQEGIEMTRSGRDRNAPITGSFQLRGQDITSWDDPDFWLYQISTNCVPNCYFNIITPSNTNPGGLHHLTAAPSIPLTAEPIGQFTRVAILSDDSNYQTQKIVTVVVTWKDFAGSHESRLTTYLRKL